MNPDREPSKSFESRSGWAESAIQLHPAGFSVGASTVHWSEVCEVCAFKLDLITTDEARFRIVLQSGQCIELSEEQPGFTSFASALVAKFPSAAGWESKVLLPAFAANLTTLYRRA